MTRPGEVAAQTPRREPERPWLAVLVLPFAVVLGALVILARAGGQGAASTIWAEDGTIFLQQASGAPLTEVIGDSYAGYLHVVPRLLTQPVTWLPLSWADTYLAGMAALVTAAVALTIYAVTAVHMPSRLVRAGYAVAVLVVPVSQSETLANVANLHWWLILVSFWLLLWHARTPWSNAVVAAVVLLAVLSDPLTLLLLPLAVVRLRRRSAWWAHLPEAALGVGGVLALLGAWLAPDDRAFHLLLNPVRLAGYFVANVLVGGVWGARATEDVATRTLALWAVASLLVLVPLAWLVWRAWRRAVVRWCLGMSVLLYVTPVALTGVAAPRYALVPVLLLYGAVAVAVDEALVRRRSAVEAGRQPSPGWLTSRWWALGLVLPLAVLAWNFAPTSGARSAGAAWDSGLTQARGQCQIPARVQIPITPSGWTVILDCAALRR